VWRTSEAKQRQDSEEKLIQSACIQNEYERELLTRAVVPKFFCLLRILSSDSSLGNELGVFILGLSCFVFVVVSIPIKSFFVLSKVHDKHEVF